ncbi:oxidoreductase [Lutibacter sp.]|uniref:sialidase family protein n=1 Tax=Lutibacter sp. TaxID=1925666 RepID=UPI001A335088|nr:oxidoreductase [Lutibacter sp.]MBI9042417.1 oxidoreductase [Lutibacter sp.]
MKLKAILFLALILLISCEKSYISRETVTVTIEKFKMDSTSIRAIEIVNDSTVVYASSIGDLGVISGSGKLKGTQKIITDTIIPHFRALAYTKEAVYALNVGNPALLYQYKNNKIEIVYKEQNEKVFYDSMQFFDELNGIAMGDPTDNCLSILITRDGGNTWGKINCEDLPKIEEGEAAFAASNTNIAIVGENAWIVTGGLKARVFHSSDMGLTWKVYDTPIIQGQPTTGIYSVAFANEYEGIICGGDYTNKFGNSANKAITKDGGRTWKVVAENKEPQYISCVQYVPETDGKELFAVSTNGIFYSNNAGENWEKVSDEGFYTIRIVNKNTAWLSGEEVIAKMTIK